MHICLSVYHMCARCPWKTEEGNKWPSTRDADSCEPLWECGESNSRRSEPLSRLSSHHHGPHQSFYNLEMEIRSPCLCPEHFIKGDASPVLEIFSKSGGTQHLHRGVFLFQNFYYKCRHFVPSSGNEANSPCWRSRVAINLVEERSSSSNFTFFFMFVVIYIYFL